MRSKRKGRKLQPKSKPRDSDGSALVDAVVQKYTELADHLLKSDSAVAPDESDSDVAERKKAS